MKIWKQLDTKWYDRKRTILGLPWSFTKYYVTGEKLYIETGFFTTKQEEIKLYRITDFQVSVNFRQKIFGIGTIRCHAMDKTTPVFEIKNIKNPFVIKELLSDLCDEAREKNHVYTRENFYDTDDDGPDDYDIDDNE
ncbi:MAG: PH domain-containing protein [Clostridia bacterium]|nr:PH domain-containing protein [Clostridia bacterium]